MPQKLRSFVILLLVVSLTGFGSVLAQDDEQVTFMSTQFNIVRKARPSAGCWRATTARLSSSPLKRRT